MTWYENNDAYVIDKSLPGAIVRLAGPKGVALLDVFKDGRTTPGWALKGRDGKPGFIENYNKLRFWDKPRKIAYVNNKLPFAIVMRSVNMIMVDIDRHLDDNGADGFVSAAKLNLPVTLAETSKSGNGRHLYYSTDDIWDEQRGFAKYDDAIGLVPGVDIRAVGCSFHHATQRWNNATVAPLPDNLRELLQARQERKTALNTQIESAASNPDTEEAMLLHHSLLLELEKPVAPGKRNMSLFALGSKMKEADYPEWNEAIQKRAKELGLPQDESEKLISNIQQYG